jgi:hypothetical protein
VLRNQFVPGRRAFLYSQTETSGGPIPSAQESGIELSFGAIETSPASGDQNEEYIELRNPHGFAVDLSGWSLQGSVAMTLHPGTVVPAGKSLYLTPDVVAFRGRSTGPSGGQGLLVTGSYTGRLPSRGGQIELVDGSGHVAAAAAPSGETTAAERYLRITELMYHPADDPIARGFSADDFEYLELRNTSLQTPVPLSTVRLSGGIEFDFGNSGIDQLGPGELVLVVKDRVAFEARYGAGYPIAGEYTGSLSNGGERIVLTEGGTPILDFAYQDAWYPATDGGGYSLETVNAWAAVSSWNQPSNWQPSRPLHGTPGSSDQPVPGDANGDGRFDSSDLVHVLQAGQYEDRVPHNSTFNEGDWNGDGEFDSADLVTVFQAGTFLLDALPPPPSDAVDPLWARPPDASRWLRGIIV